MTTRLALFTDVHFSERAPKNGLLYADVLPRLKQVVAEINAHCVNATLQLGDLTEEGEPHEREAILPILEALKAPCYHLLGNHDLHRASETAWLKAWQIPQAYYAHPLDAHWTLIALHTLEISPHSRDSHQHQLALEIIQRRQQRELDYAQEWNGQPSDTQLQWLAEQLNLAHSQGRNVLLASHLPLHPQSASPLHGCWQHDEIRKILRNTPCVRAVFQGHDHAGGYCCEDAIHYLTFPALGVGKHASYAIATLEEKRITIEGEGKMASQTLPLHS